jgi:hypothetical protein
MFRTMRGSPQVLGLLRMESGIEAAESMKPEHRHEARARKVVARKPLPPSDAVHVVAE